MHRDTVFLGKSGKIYGPFTQVELDELSAQGQLSHYFWIWSWKTLRWNPIESPPPRPVELSQKDTVPILGVDWSLVNAIGFDAGHLIRGKLKWITQSGCTLISEQKEEGPLFPIEGKLRLNLHNPTERRGNTVSVILKKVNFERSHWNYYLKWKELPELIKIL